MILIIGSGSFRTSVGTASIWSPARQLRILYKVYDLDHVSSRKMRFADPLQVRKGRRRPRRLSGDIKAKSKLWPRSRRIFAILSGRTGVIARVHFFLPPLALNTLEPRGRPYFCRILFHQRRFEFLTNDFIVEFFQLAGSLCLKRGYLGLDRSMSSLELADPACPLAFLQLSLGTVARLLYHPARTCQYTFAAHINIKQFYALARHLEFLELDSNGHSRDFKTKRVRFRSPLYSSLRKSSHVSIRDETPTCELSIDSGSLPEVKLENIAVISLPFIKSMQPHQRWFCFTLMPFHRQVADRVYNHCRRLKFLYRVVHQHKMLLKAVECRARRKYLQQTFFTHFSRSTPIDRMFRTTCGAGFFVGEQHRPFAAAARGFDERRSNRTFARPRHARNENAASAIVALAAEHIVKPLNTSRNTSSRHCVFESQ